MFLAVTGFGLISTWLAKVTLMYMLPDDSQPDGQHPGKDAFKTFILPQFEKSHFNANNLFTLGFDIPPATAAYLWMFFFISALAGFSVWYAKLYHPQAVGLGLQAPKSKVGKEKSGKRKK